MVSLPAKFRVVLLTPRARVLDSRCGSLILPGHDGLVGVMRNHAPMLCKLAMGIMQVKSIPDRDDAYYLIDGGFARISLNNATILAYDVTTFEGMEKEQVEEILSRARAVVVGKAYIHSNVEAADAEKAALLVKMGRLASLLD